MSGPVVLGTAGSLQRPRSQVAASFKVSFSLGVASRRPSGWKGLSCGVPLRSPTKETVKMIAVCRRLKSPLTSGEVGVEKETVPVERGRE